MKELFSFAKNICSIYIVLRVFVGNMVHLHANRCSSTDNTCLCITSICFAFYVDLI